MRDNAHYFMPHRLETGSYRQKGRSARNQGAGGNNGKEGTVYEQE